MNSQLSRAKFGWMFFWTRTLGSNFRQFRSRAFYLRHPCHVGGFTGHCCAAGSRSRHFSGRTCSAQTQRLDRLSDRFAGCGAERDLRAAGNFHRRAFDAHDRGTSPESARSGFCPFFKGPNYGVGFLTAGIVLAIMIVPFIISVSREVLLTVPREQREAALALGATRWESTWQVVVPWARTGIMGSVFLALGARSGRDHGRYDGDRE